MWDPKRRQAGTAAVAGTDGITTGLSLYWGEGGKRRRIDERVLNRVFDRVEKGAEKGKSVSGRVEKADGRRGECSIEWRREHKKGRVCLVEWRGKTEE